MLLYIYALLLFSFPHTEHAQPTNSGCTFDVNSIHNIERWWNGDGSDLDKADINCVSRGVGRGIGTVAGAFGGSQAGAWLGGMLGDMIGLKEDGARIGSMLGFQYGMNKGGEWGEVIGGSISLASLLGGSSSSSSSGEDQHNNNNNKDKKFNNFNHADSKRETLSKCYKLMSCSPSSTKKEIKSAYRNGAREAHPDKHGGVHEHMVNVNLCYEIVLLANTGSSSRGGG